MPQLFEDKRIQRAATTLFVIGNPGQKCVDGALHSLFDEVEKGAQTSTDARKLLLEAYSAKKIISTKALKRYGKMTYGENPTVLYAFETLFGRKPEQKHIDAAAHNLIDLIEQRSDDAANARLLLQEALGAGLTPSTKPRQRYAAICQAEREAFELQRRAANTAKQARNKANRKDRAASQRAAQLAKGSGGGGKNQNNGGKKGH